MKRSPIILLCFLLAVLAALAAPRGSVRDWQAMPADISGHREWLTSAKLISCTTRGPAFATQVFSTVPGSAECPVFYYPCSQTNCPTAEPMMHNTNIIVTASRNHGRPMLSYSVQDVSRYDLLQETFLRNLWIKLPGKQNSSEYPLWKLEFLV